MRSNSKNRFLVGLLILCLPIAVILVPNPIPNFVRSSVSFLFSPILKSFHKIYQVSGKISQNISRLSEAKRRESKLRQDLEKLTWEVFRLREISAEYKNLTKMLEYRDLHQDLMILSRVIGRDPSLWNQVLIIDKGARSNIKLGMPIVTSDGVLGKISRVSDEASEVLLLTDFRSRIGAMNERTREFGIVRGDNQGGLILEMISDNAELDINDEVLTSGLGGYFPKGLIIGKVVKIKEKGLNWKAYVEPNANFSNVEDALVILRENLWSELKH